MVNEMSRYIALNKVLSELGLDHKDYVYIDKHEVAERIKKLPTIDIEPKRGKWIWDEQILGLVCSECKELGVERSNFCPNCGARMKGADDEYD